MPDTANRELIGTPPHARGSMEWESAFFAALEETGVILRACKAASVGRTTVWARRRDEPEFAKRFEESLKSGALTFEAEAARRARDGLVRKKFTKNGVPIIDPATGEQYVEHEYSDMLLLALLRRHFPDNYREKQVGDINVTTNVLTMTQPQLESLQDRRRKAESLLLTNGEEKSVEPA